jgi:putative ATPase
VSDLFSQDDDDTEVVPGRPVAPLAVRMRPRSLDELVGQQHLLAAGSPLRRLIEAADGVSGPTSLLLWGPPGTGKTTLAHVISQATGRRFVELAAITAGVRDVRRIMEEARDARDLHQKRTVLFLDEIHRFTKAQQDALLPGVENRWIVLVAATTENPSFSVISPLISRSLVLALKPLDDGAIRALLTRAVQDPRGLGGQVLPDEDALDHLVRLSSGDARRGLTALEAAAGVALDEAALRDDAAGARGEVAADRSEPVVLTLEAAERALDRAAIRYDRQGDQHYDVTSAFIKSMRGSDVDAALHYLARMLEAGEDPRFIARRIMIAASEDVGMADPTALQTAVAAAEAVALIGMPEGRIILAQAVVHIATAPKSNASYLAIGAALEDVKSGRAGEVPMHLRDAHYPGAKRLGHGTGYRYSHDDPRGVVQQQYLPDGLEDAEYYQPTERGAEREIHERLAKIRGILRRRS